MSRKSFGKLLQKYLRGECTPEEKAFVEHWYGLLETDHAESVQELDWAELETRLWDQMQQKRSVAEQPDEARIMPLHTARYRWMGVAAAVLLVAGWFVSQRFATDWMPLSTLTSVVNANWTDQTNTSTKPLLIRLEDGSTVQLAAQSSLRYPKTFASSERTVYLTGDAFFTIQKMPSRPFYVHTGKVVTKVLGTSFFVRTQSAANQVRVEVVTGRVAVYEETPRKQTPANGVVLSPNQVATFFENEQHFVTGLVDKPVVIQASEANNQLSFRFDDTPLSEVIKRLELAYGIAIDVENELLNNCPLTANLTNQSLYTQLDIICAALKSSYEVQGTTILISGKGCTN